MSEPKAADWRIEWNEVRPSASANPANPEYPQGRDFDLRLFDGESCRGAVPYPAGGVGYHRVICLKCGYRMSLSASGLADDPRSLTMNCDTTKSMAKLYDKKANA